MYSDCKMYFIYNSALCSMSSQEFLMGDNCMGVHEVSGALPPLVYTDLTILLLFYNHCIRTLINSYTKVYLKKYNPYV